MIEEGWEKQVRMPFLSIVKQPHNKWSCRAAYRTAERDNF